jgi:hypothetical protein
MDDDPALIVERTRGGKQGVIGLIVRRLASGQQLLWLPVREATAQTAVDALALLFALHGAPLVLKSDNGPAFCAEATGRLLGQFSVMALFSPAYWPRYNGAIEAGIGSLKNRTAYQAARHGHALWTCDDVAAAHEEANATSRPQGGAGASAAQLWQHAHRSLPRNRRFLIDLAGISALMVQ